VQLEDETGGDSGHPKPSLGAGMVQPAISCRPLWALWCQTGNGLAFLPLLHGSIIRSNFFNSCQRLLCFWCSSLNWPLGLKVFRGREGTAATCNKHAQSVRSGWQCFRRLN